MNKYLSSLGAISALGAAIGGGGIIPSVTAFTNLAPPLFTPISFITSGLAVCVIFFVCGRKKASTVGHANVAFLISTLLLIVYAILFYTCTSVAPGDQPERFQIGFGRANWSLTPKGEEMKRKYPNDTVEDWMLKVGAYRPHGSEILWRVGAVIGSGTIMMFVFLIGFISWAFGWSVWARRLADANIKLKIPMQA